MSAAFNKFAAFVAVGDLPNGLLDDIYIIGNAVAQRAYAYID
jgi:hypothetical protein